MSDFTAQREVRDQADDEETITASDALKKMEARDKGPVAVEMPAENAEVRIRERCSRDRVHSSHGLPNCRAVRRGAPHARILPRGIPGL